MTEKRPAASDGLASPWKSKPVRLGHAVERVLLSGNCDYDSERPVWKRLLLVSFSLLPHRLAARTRLGGARCFGV